MFFVGVYSTFHGMKQAELTKVKILEKFGHHPARAKRWLDAHKPKIDGDDRYRAIVFVLPHNFRLRNDVIQLTMKRFKCDWQTAKFHIYRESLVDVVGNKEDWAEFFPEDKPTVTEPNSNEEKTAEVVDQQKQYEEHAKVAGPDEFAAKQEAPASV